MLVDLTERDLQILVDAGSNNPLVVEARAASDMSKSWVYPTLSPTLAGIVSKIFAFGQLYGKVKAVVVTSLQAFCTCGHRQKNHYNLVWGGERSRILLCDKCFREIVETVFLKDNYPKELCEWPISLTKVEPAVLRFDVYRCVDCGWFGDVTTATHVKTNEFGLYCSACPVCDSPVVMTGEFNLRKVN